jgi:hypothetical protein
VGVGRTGAARGWGVSGPTLHHAVYSQLASGGRLPQPAKRSAVWHNACVDGNNSYVHPLQHTECPTKPACGTLHVLLPSCHPQHSPSVSQMPLIVGSESAVQAVGRLGFQTVTLAQSCEGFGTTCRPARPISSSDTTPKCVRQGRAVCRVQACFAACLTVITDTQLWYAYPEDRCCSHQWWCSSPPPPPAHCLHPHAYKHGVHGCVYAPCPHDAHRFRWP